MSALAQEGRPPRNGSRMGLRPGAGGALAAHGAGFVQPADADGEPTSAAREAETRAGLVEPALYGRGWTEDLICGEQSAGAVELAEGRPPRRAEPRRAYLLRVRPTQDAHPVAVALLELTAQQLPAAQPLERSKRSAACRRLHVPLLYATDGHLYVEFSQVTGGVSPQRPLVEFPTPAELQARYEELAGFSLQSEVARPLLMSYRGGEACRRDYQDAAVRAALERVARGERRVLLSLAAGTGHTIVATHLLGKIADAGLLRRALVIAGRDELGGETLTALQSAFGAEVADVSAHPARPQARILIAGRQALESGNSGALSSLATYPEDFFSHIVIDECCGPAWSAWSLIQARQSSAVQLGLTDAPRQPEHQDRSVAAVRDEQLIGEVLAYFGEPAYEYGLAQGIQDGYLTLCELVRRTDAGPARPQTAEEAEALAAEVEEALQEPEHLQKVCDDLFQNLLATEGPEQKTAIFCLNEEQADRVVAELNRLYAYWCEQLRRPRLLAYAFKLTPGSQAAAVLTDFRDSTRSHFVAATAGLLAGGTDAACVRNVVLLRYPRSPLALHRKVGRGMRFHPPSGKLLLRVYDYSGASRLLGLTFLTRATARSGVEPEPPGPAAPDTVASIEGISVHRSPAGQYLLTVSEAKTVPVTIEEYKARVAVRLLGQAPTLNAFRAKWAAPLERARLLAALPDAGRSATVVREVTGRRDCDLYDALAELAYGIVPKTRAERATAFAYKNASWLAGLPPAAATAIRALAAQFAHAGTEGFENPQLLQSPEVSRGGGLYALQAMGEPGRVLRDVRERLLAP